MKVYKITNKDGYTRHDMDGETKWGENVCHRIKKKGNTLCSDEVFHCYKDPYLAIFINPDHGNYNTETLLLWEAKTPKIVADDGAKSGCKTLTTIKKIPVPTFITEQLVEIAIRCAMKVCTDEKFQDWAIGWITNQDRSADAADAARSAAWSTADAAYAAWSAVWSAADAAYVARSAADAARYATNAASAARSAADAASAARSAAYAAQSAAYVARSAADVARSAADAADAVYAAQFVSDVAIKININSIIQEVLNESN